MPLTRGVGHRFGGDAEHPVNGMGIKDCRCRIVGKESSPLHQADLVADLQRLPEIVHDAQHSPPLSAQSPDQPQQFKTDG